MEGEKFTGSVETLPVSDGTLHALGGEAIMFGQDIEPAGDISHNTSGGGSDADFGEDAPKQPKDFLPFAGFSD